MPNLNLPLDEGTENYDLPTLKNHLENEHNKLPKKLQGEYKKRYEAELDAIEALKSQSV